jgi:hypothetical protein
VVVPVGAAGGRVGDGAAGGVASVDGAVDGGGSVGGATVVATVIGGSVPTTGAPVDDGTRATVTIVVAADTSSFFV